MSKRSYYAECSWSDSFGYCMGTKEMESCSCQGDEPKCNYYPEKRDKKMNTLEMMNLAKENNKTYRTDDMLYSNNFGFHDKPGKKRYRDVLDYLNDLFAIDNWKEDNTIYMTKSEAESKYGIKIVGY